jgi:hypothetical protein
MADPSIQQSQLYARPPDRCRRLLFWSVRNRGLGKMTTGYSQVEQGKKIFGTAVLFFSQGLTWFGLDSPGGISTLQQLKPFDALFRLEIVIGAIVAAYGMLVWRSAFRKLSHANYVIVAFCVAALLPCVSKQSEWVYLLNHQNGFWILNDLGILVIEITIPVWIFVMGAWWADSTFLRERFHAYMRSSRFVK